MIKKIKEIKNLAVFQNFEWDKSVIDHMGNPVDFKHINILYGRNYSGKTTLSRILRAIENGKISDKFEDPSFKVSFSDSTEIKQDNLINHGKKVRVFNEDFVRENLKFIINPDESIKSFAILGDSNNEIEGEIEKFELELGSNEEEKESGLYASLKQENKNLKLASSNYQIKNGQLDAKLNAKATDRTIGIKYNAEKFGDQNYSRPKLDRDIAIVLKTTYKTISSLEQIATEKLLTETINDLIPNLPDISLNFINYNTEAKTLICQEIGQSDKIEELVKDAVLNKWVKEGKQLHKDKRSNCAFCNNAIQESRWEELEKHFDEESLKLENSIDELIAKISLERNSITNNFKPDKTLFYSKFHSKIERLIQAYSKISQKYIAQLDTIKKQLENRKNDLIHPKEFTLSLDYSKRLGWIIDIYIKVKEESDNYSSSLSSDQVKAKETLRFKEVFDFLTTIKYSEENKIVLDLKTLENEAKSKKDGVTEDIFQKKQQIEDKRRLLKDETKGADKVNEYLNNFFGHGFLSLKAIESEIDGTKKFRFEVIRDGKKAYHLSEGEYSLIAFCYFMAKLEDIETKGAKPIIWIDDPISSLDGNHIFFVYSILNVEIVSKNIFEQLFVSTHNLDFLKYLKRLSGKNESNQDYQKSYLVIQRHDKTSSLSLMPKYLKDFVTEFNYLFHQIFNCSKITVIDDSNYTTFYNFGNNARKFLEVYLYYRYPDSSDENKKLQKFFGGEKIPTIFTDRINNEYSHLSGVFERGATPTEVPEMKSAAELIIRRIKEADEDQYNSLLLSIGETA